MLRETKQPEPDEAAGAPEWMVTFSDCMTLLLTFFVLLLSFSSFDDKIFWKLRVIFSGSMPSVRRAGQKDKDAFLRIEQIEMTTGLDEGSEKPTLAKGSQDRSKQETEPEDFHSRKVFLISSRRVFWGKGTTISSEGGRIITTMATFLKEVPSRVVISENGSGDDKSDEQLGLARAWAVLEYFTAKQGLDKKWFSISVTGTLAQESFVSGIPAGTRLELGRTLEIVLLERSIYN